MYYLVQTEPEVRLLHKNESILAIADVAWIEAQNSAYCLFSATDPSGFGALTPRLQAALYSSLCGVAHGANGVTWAGLQAALWELASAVPVSQIVPREAASQAALVAEGSRKPWRYVLGSSLPGLAQQEIT